MGVHKILLGGTMIVLKAITTILICFMMFSMMSAALSDIFKEEADEGVLAYYLCIIVEMLSLICIWG